MTTYTELDISLLPANVTSIKFGCFFNKSVDKLPKYVKTVCFNGVKHKYIYNNIHVRITKFIHDGKNNNLNNIFSLKYYITSSKIKKLPYGCVKHKNTRCAVKQKIEY